MRRLGTCEGYKGSAAVKAPATSAGENLGTQAELALGDLEPLSGTLPSEALEDPREGSSEEGEPSALETRTGLGNCKFCSFTFLK